jgi:tRNA(Phe) wybutosine-synthesizing methylase Tyw3
MAVVKKAQSIPKIARKNGVRNSSIQSAREPSVISEMGDTSFGELDASKDGLIVSYDAGTNKFVLKSSDELLSTSVEDNNIPDEFVRVLEGELNLGQIQVESLDGGVF